MCDLNESDKAIFRVALSLEDAEVRAQFLNNACRDNDQLRREIDSLLAADASADGFLSMAVASLDGNVDATENGDEQSPSEFIGRYKLLQRIGDGGFGDVYMAEQSEPIVRRVALKVIKLGMDTRQVIARFEAERQALAMMEHPNIAKVLDAGATKQGRPYFVMELVRGNPATEFCDENRLTTKQRLRLFADICGAVQHAHQKGIIHRDLKPSNVLVTPSDDGPVPKIIDFGIAKATQTQLTDKTLFTRFEQFVGTPSYMSPEQADHTRSDVDTRSDVYSLGVLLYELLTGRTPLDQEAMRGVGFDKMRRHICKHDSPTPSTQFASLSQAERSTIAENRGADPRILDGMLRQELDWVVMKALEKDRSRRYQSAAELEDDVRRYLSGDPVAAVPPTTFYKLRKFAGRNRGLLVASFVLAATMILATIVSAWQAICATDALQNSRRARAELALDKGQMFGEQGDPNRALLWIARSLELVPEGAPELERVIRTNLGSWQHRVHRILQMFAPTGRVDAVSFTPDNDALVTAARLENDGVVIQRWNCDNGQCTQTIEHLNGRVLALSLNGDASKMAIGYADGRIELFELETREAMPLETQPGFITKVRFSPDGSRLLVACGRRAITQQEGADENSQAMQGGAFVQLFDAKTGRPQFAEPLEQPNLVWAADFARDGTWFAVHSGPWIIPLPGRVSFFKITGEELRPSLPVPVTAMCIAVSSDGRHLLTGDPARRALLWSLETNEIVDEFASDAPVSVVKFSPVNDDIVLSGSFDGSVRLWNAHSGQLLGTPMWHGDLVRCADFSDDGETLVSGSTEAVLVANLPIAMGAPPHPSYAPDDPIALDRGRSAILVRENDRLQLKSAISGQPIGQSLPCKGPIISAACDAESGRAVVIQGTGVATLWNLTAGQPIARLQHGNEPALSTAFSDQGLVAVGFFDGIATLFDAGTGTPMNQEYAHVSHTGPVFSIDFHGDLMLTGGADGFARLWNVTTGNEQRAFHHPTHTIAAFSPDGIRIATSGSDQTTRVWSTEGNLIAAPLRHPSQAWTPVFSEDGRTLLTGCSDGNARLWDVATARQLGSAMTHTKDIDGGPHIHVAFWPDRHSVMTSTGPSNMVPASQTTEAVYHEIPRPMAGKASDVTLWVETITGMRLDDDGAADVLRVDAWRKCRDQLTQRGDLARTER